MDQIPTNCISLNEAFEWLCRARNPEQPCPDPRALEHDEMLRVLARGLANRVQSAGDTQYVDAADFKTWLDAYCAEREKRLERKRAEHSTRIDFDDSENF